MKKNRGALSVIALIFIMALAISVFPISAYAAEATEYRYFNGNEWANGSQNATVIEADTLALEAGWYVARGDVTIADRITVTGDVHLILSDGATLTASEGIGVAVGNSLSVYGQTLGTGKLIAEGNKHAGIGGSMGADGVSSTKWMSGYDFSAVTDGAAGGSMGSLTVYGGSITANGSKGAAIGGGAGGNGGGYSVSGSLLADPNGYSGAGQGCHGGVGGDGGTVVIYGGAINTNKTIGGGDGGKGGDTGGKDNYGGNGGKGGKGGSFTMYGGSVNIEATDFGIGNGIGGSEGANQDHYNGGSSLKGSGGAEGDPATVRISGGTLLIKSGKSAINGAPDFSGYEDAVVIAATNRDGNSPEIYDASKNLSYKYMSVSNVVTVSSAIFPDEIFRNWILGQEYGADGILTVEELSAVTGINVYNKGISSLKGIEFFTAITYLNVSNNKLTELDVSSLTLLEQLLCGTNQIASLELGNNTRLTQLYCQDNLLEELNLKNNTELKKMVCNKNGLKKLDLSNNKKLEEISCAENKLTGLDLSANAVLAYLDCRNNSLSALDLSNNTALTKTYFSDNCLVAIDLAANTALSATDGIAQSATVARDIYNKVDIGAYDKSFDGARAIITAPKEGAAFNGTVLALDEDITEVKYNYPTGYGSTYITVTLTVTAPDPIEEAAKLDSKLDKAIEAFKEALANGEAELLEEIAAIEEAYAEADSALEEAIAEMQKKLDAAMSAFDTKNTQLEERIAALEQKSTGLEDKVSALGQQNADLEAKQKELREAGRSNDTAITVLIVVVCVIGAIALGGTVAIIAAYVKKRKGLL